MREQLGQLMLERQAMINESERVRAEGLERDTLIKELEGEILKS